MISRPLLLIAVALALLAGCTQPARPTASSHETRRPIVILISLDAFRWDYIERYSLSHLGRLADEGVRVRKMRPAFPTSTFPNHYTLVTGLYPGHHGIVSNRFLDPDTGVNFSYGSPRPETDSFWGGEPIWVTAERQGLSSACMFWPGSEAEIRGARPRHWLPYQHDLPIADRLRQVLDWLALPEEQKPSVVTLYFHHADSTGHTFGIDSEPLREAVAAIDGAIGELRSGIEALDLVDRVHLVIAADHGMTPVDQNRVVAIDDWLVPNRDAVVSFSGAVTGLWPVDPLTADDLVTKLSTLPGDFEVWRREELPARWHLSRQTRMGPVVVVAKPGAKLAPRASLRILEAAAHGYDETSEDMAGTFLAWGSRYRRGVVLPSIDNIHVYELLCATLGLTPAANDGDDRLARDVLAP